MQIFSIIVFFCLSVCSWSKVVLIDPGHGGEELGAVAYLDKNKKKPIYEKDLCLKLAKKIKKYLSKSTSVYLTRSFDRTVSLEQRAELAEMVKADLFISIHFNSTRNSKSHGFELYYLDNSSNIAAQKVEKAENLNLKGEDSVVNQILVDLVVQQTVRYSRELAQAVHTNVAPVVKKHGLSDRGIKRGLFYVLALSKRPGVLIEGGFISNQTELKKIMDETYLNEMAREISKGILEYVKNQK